MSEQVVTCDCRSGQKPIGKCYHCGALICERCVAFVAARSVCKSCAKTHEQTIIMNVRQSKTIEAPRGRAIEVQMQDSIFTGAEVTVHSKYKLRRLWAMLQKCVEDALFITGVTGAIAAVVFICPVLDFCSGMAFETQDLRNPLAKLTIKAAARTDLMFAQYDASIGLYGRYIDRYNDQAKLEEVYFNMAQGMLGKKEYKMSRYYYQRFLAMYPQSAHKAEVERQIEIINNILRLQVEQA